MKISSSFWVVLTVAMGLAAIVYLFSTQPAIAPAFTAILLPFLVGIVASLQSTAKATAQSQENAQSIAAVSAQQSHANDEQSQIAKRTEAKVDGHLGGLMQRLELLEQKNASLEKAAALKASTDAQATANKEEIIAATQTAVSDAAALAPPAVDAVTP